MAKTSRFDVGRVVTLGFLERFRSIANCSLEAILYLGKDGSDGKLTCASIEDEWLFHRGEAKVGDEVRQSFSCLKACWALNFQYKIFRFLC